MTFIKRLIIFFTLALLPFSVHSQSLNQNTNKTSYFDYATSTIADDGKHIFNLGISFIQLPLNYDRQNLNSTFYYIAATSALFLIDHSIKQIALRNRNKFSDKIFKIEDYLNGGKGKFTAAGVYAAGFIFKEEKLRLAGLYLAETLYLAKSITSLLKYSFGRRRPYAGNDNMDYKLFRGKKSKYRAFPSGHTTGAFAFATVMAMSVDNIYWKTGWYGSAALVGLARIYHNVHWLSDTFLAGVISYNVANYVVNFNSKEINTKSLLTFSIYPNPNGITASLQF